MVFGNWLVTDNSITWRGGETQRFEILAGQLVAKRRYNDNVVFYEAVLSATSLDWLSQNDLYDLNYAFVYAVAVFDLEFDYEIFDATLAQQYDMFEEEEDDEDEDDS